MTLNLEKLMVEEEVSPSSFRFCKFNERKNKRRTLENVLEELEKRRKEIRWYLLDDRLLTENNLIKNEKLFGIKDFGLINRSRVNRLLKYITLLHKEYRINDFEDEDGINTIQDENNSLKIYISYEKEIDYAPYPYCSDFSVYYKDDDEDEVDYYLCVKYFLNDKLIVDIKQEAYLCGYDVGFDYSKTGFLFEINNELIV